MASSFESKQAAKERHDKELADEVAGERHKQIHIGNFGNITWDCNALRTEVESYPDDAKVNWTALARQFQIRNNDGQIAKNGGQIAKDWLVHQGLNIQRFKRTQSGPENGERWVWRKKFRGLGGKWISYFLCVVQCILTFKNKILENMCSSYMASTTCRSCSIDYINGFGIQKKKNNNDLISNLCL